MIDVLYIEKDALGLPFSRKIRAKLPSATVVPIDRWEDVFYRKKQNFALQKKDQNLIVGINRGGFVMQGSDNCQSTGADVFAYCSFAKNCIAGCGYCYLQGMMRSGNLLAFANMEDCFGEVRGLLERERISENRKLLLAVSYDNDIYALEGLFGYIGMWSDFVDAEQREGLTVEIRTKCGTRQFVDHAKPSNGSLVFTWSVSSPENIKKYEPMTSDLKARLDAAAYAVKKGFRVRLALDPVLDVSEGPGGYVKLCEEIRARNIGEKLDAVMLGGFRIPADYLKIMRKNAPSSPIAFDSYEVREGTACYAPEREKKLTDLIAGNLVKTAGVPGERIFILDREAAKG